MMRVVLRGATSLWLVFLVALGARLSFAWNQERKIPYDVLAPASLAQETGSIASALAVVASEAAIGDAITRFYGGASTNEDQGAQSSDRVRTILSGLPARDRDLLKAVLLEEKDQDAVCREFGVDRDYLRVLLHRAKEKLKSLPASLSEQQEC